MLVGYARVSSTNRDPAPQVVTVKTVADEARLFKVHPVSVTCLLTQARHANPQKSASRSGSKKTGYAK